MDRRARGDRRGPHDAGRPGARGDRHPRHERAHDLAVPRQAVDEGGAARRPACPRRRPPRSTPLPRRRSSPTASATRSSSSPARAPAPGHRARRQRGRARAGRCRRFGARGRDARSPIEEFVEGHEGFYDTITLDGRVVHDWVTHYYPNVLEAMRHRWISPQFITTNRIDDRQLLLPGGARRSVSRVIEALGIETSATHMEWFYGPKGLQVLRDRLPPAGRRRVGPLLRGQRRRRLPRVGAHHHPPPRGAAMKRSYAAGHRRAAT